jgi:oligoribonuclease NrnB/cAMP/cGMP phosphodiesterase (DHH superfamily)
MNDEQTIQVFTHLDLDGVVSYLVLCWAYGKKLDVIPTTPMRLQQDYQKFVESKKTYSKLFFLDLDVSSIGSQIDDKKTVIFDHHKTNIYSFQNALFCVYNETSCAKLIYDYLFKATNKQISSQQKTLIALADDWDSATKATPLSEGLNIVYHSMSNKFNSFVEDYYNGFEQFDKFKQNTITLYKKHRAEYLDTLTPFFGKVEFEGQKDIKVGAVFCDKFVQECCDWLFAIHHVDVAIAVLIDQKRIAVRRNANCDKVDVSKFVQRIASGGGHEAAAGGNLTDEFVEFTKMLKPL